MLNTKLIAHFMSKFSIEKSHVLSDDDIEFMKKVVLFDEISTHSEDNIHKRKTCLNEIDQDKRLIVSIDCAFTKDVPSQEIQLVRSY